MKLLTSLGAMVADSLLVASVASATAIIEQKVNFSGPTKTITLSGSSTTLMFSDPFSFALFNPALGMLNSVTVNVDSLLSFTYGATVTNPSKTSAQQYLLEMDANVDTSALPTGDTFSDSFLYQFKGNISPTKTGSPTSTVPLKGGKSFASSDSATYFDPDFDVFIGNGSFTGTVTANAVIKNTLNTTGSVTGTGSGDIEVIYEYSPIPEPGTMVLLGFGALGLAVYSKRRKNNC